MEVPASGGKVEIVFPVSVPGRPSATLTFDIPAPGGTVRCTTMLARNSPTDRAKAISYVEQAVSVIEQSIDSDEVRVVCRYSPPSSFL